MASPNTPDKPPRGKQLAELFFTRTDPKSNVWKCKCGTERVQNTTGYTNLCSPVMTCHPEFIHLTSNVDANQTLISTMLIPRAVRKLYGWLQWIIFSMLPFSFCENDMARMYSNLEPISTDTFMKYMSKLSDCVEKKIAKILPDTFAIVFDGWSIGLSHYVAVYATFSSNDVIGYKKVLLGFSPINEEDSLNAVAHFDYLTFVLGVYGKQMSNVVAMIGDNCPTNVAFAHRCSVPFVGCASHRFNLFVGDILTEYEPLLDLVNELMKKLKHLLPAARLRRLTHLAPKTRNLTRWSSTYSMLKRYVAIRAAIRTMADRDLVPYLPTDEQDSSIDALLAVLAELDSVTLALQDEGATLQDVRSLFDEVMATYPAGKARLAANAEIVDNHDFESSVVKILAKNSKSLSVGQKKSVGRLKRPPKVSAAPAATMSLLERAKKRQKTAEQDAVYIDCRFIRPTSNMCERFFSWAKFALTDRRQGILPINFERQMFLKVNSDFWDIGDIATLVSKTS